jgi:hypothetical protein
MRWIVRILMVLCATSSMWAMTARESWGSPEECQEAASEYKSARSEIASALQAYASCLSSTDGHDDCSSEFETLRSDQDDFENAVSSYESECN